MRNLLGGKAKGEEKGNSSKGRLFKRAVTENFRRATNGANGERNSLSDDAGNTGATLRSPGQRMSVGLSEMAGTARDPLIENLLQGARSEKVRAEFRAIPPSDYTEHSPLTLLVGSYNVNGRIPSPGLDLSKWLDASSEPDIVAVAFQEIVPLSASNVVMGASLEAAATWDRLIEAAINRGAPPSPPPRENGHVIIRSRSGSANLHDAAPDLFSMLNQGMEGSQFTDMDQGLRALEDFNQGDGLPYQHGNGHARPNPDGSQASSETDFQAPYVQVAAKQMVGLYLSVWVKRGLVPAIRGVQVTSVGTGVLGYLGNKGAVAARMRVHDSGLCLVGAHLSSGESEGDDLKRNLDYAEIVRRAMFPSDSMSVDPEALVPGNSAAQAGVSKVMAAARGPGQWGEKRGILDCDFTVWMGDLNYRLTIADATARALLRAGNLSALQAADELSTMVAQNRAFQGWAEGPVTFPPTYKLLLGTLRYHGEDEGDWASRSASNPDLSAVSSSSMSSWAADGSPNQAPGEKEKRRKPAWTDRILWRPHPHFEQRLYRSADLTASDHKPVCAEFRLKARHFVREKVEAALESARRAIDAQEMACLPRCELSPAQVEVGRVLYATERTIHLILANISQVSANFEFVPLPGTMFGEDNDRTTRSTPRWASVYPEQGSLEPGEAAEVVLRVCITGGPAGSANQLASAGCQLDAILVLRIQGGNDIFCSVTGEYVPSFFGMSLANLTAMSRPLVPAEVAMEEAMSRLQGRTGRGPLPHLRVPAKEATQDTPSHLGSEFHSAATSVASSPMGRSEHSEDLATDEKAARRRRAFQLQLLGRTASDDVESFYQGDRRASADSPIAHTPPFSHSIPSRPGRLANPNPAAVPDLISLDGPPVEPPSKSRLSQETNGGSGGAGRFAASIDPPRHRRTESVSIVNLLPPEIRALTDFLQEGSRLHTPGLFVNSAEQAFAAASEATSSSRVPAPVRTIREALDRGLPIPADASAHDVAATLLAFFAALPAPFMPAAASQVCEVCVPPASAAASLLADALSPVEWALFRHMTGLMQEALSSPAVTSNGLTLTPVATLLADLWFEGQPLAGGFSGAGQSLTEEAIHDLQRLADGVDEVEHRRALFVGLFLGPAPASLC